MNPAISDVPVHGIGCQQCHQLAQRIRELHQCLPVATIRRLIQDCVDSLSALDGAIGETDLAELPAILAARMIVHLDGIREQLEEMADLATAGFDPAEVLE